MHRIFLSFGGLCMTAGRPYATAVRVDFDPPQFAGQSSPPASSRPAACGGENLASLSCCARPDDGQHDVSPPVAAPPTSLPVEGRTFFSAQPESEERLTDPEHDLAHRPAGGTLDAGQQFCPGRQSAAPVVTHAGQNITQRPLPPI